MGRLFYVFVHLVEQYCKTSDIPGNIYVMFYFFHRTPSNDICHLNETVVCRRVKQKTSKLQSARKTRKKKDERVTVTTWRGNFQTFAARLPPQRNYAPEFPCFHWTWRRHQHHDRITAVLKRFAADEFSENFHNRPSKEVEQKNKREKQCDERHRNVRVERHFLII